jgi:hypothetical protein
MTLENTSRSNSNRAGSIAQKGRHRAHGALSDADFRQFPEFASSTLTTATGLSLARPFSAGRPSLVNPGISFHRGTVRQFR